jgi:hypothetical protein
LEQGDDYYDAEGDDAVVYHRKLIRIGWKRGQRWERGGGGVLMLLGVTGRSGGKRKRTVVRMM